MQFVMCAICHACNLSCLQFVMPACRHGWHMGTILEVRSGLGRCEYGPAQKRVDSDTQFAGRRRVHETGMTAPEARLRTWHVEGLP